MHSCGTIISYRTSDCPNYGCLDHSEFADGIVPNADDLMMCPTCKCPIRIKELTLAQGLGAES